MCETCGGIEVITSNNLGGAGYLCAWIKEAGKYHVRDRLDEMMIVWPPTPTPSSPRLRAAPGPTSSPT